MSRRIVSLIGCVGALLISSSVSAEQTPIQGAQDARIRTVTYNPRDVVKIVGHYGYHTIVEFAEGEEILTEAIGDSVAWQVTHTERGNTLSLKPQEMNAETNLTVITNRRRYTFFLTAKKGAPGPDMTWLLEFRYPEDERLAREAALARVKARKASVVSESPVEAGDLNFDYSYSGSKKFRPERIYDDGEFTYFKFSKKQERPAIFLVDDEKKESLLNESIEGAYVKVHRVGKRFSLRGNGALTCVFNDALDPVEKTPVTEPDLRTADAANGE